MIYLTWMRFLSAEKSRSFLKIGLLEHNNEETKVLVPIDDRTEVYD